MKRLFIMRYIHSIHSIILRGRYRIDRGEGTPLERSVAADFWEVSEVTGVRSGSIGSSAALLIVHIAGRRSDLECTFLKLFLFHTRLRSDPDGLGGGPTSLFYKHKEGRVIWEVKGERRGENSLSWNRSQISLSKIRITRTNPGLITQRRSLDSELIDQGISNSTHEHPDPEKGRGSECTIDTNRWKKDWQSRFDQPKPYYWIRRKDHYELFIWWDRKEEEEKSRSRERKRRSARGKKNGGVDFLVISEPIK